MAQFGPFGCYNSICDKNGIEEIIIMHCKLWLNSQTWRVETFITPGETGGLDNVWIGEPRRGDTMSLVIMDEVVNPKKSETLKKIPCYTFFFYPKSPF